MKDDIIQSDELILQFNVARIFLAEEEEEEEERLVVSLSDITNRKRSEEALKISEGKYRTLLNASPDGILIIDLKGIITGVSEISLELFGFDNKDNMIGKNFFRFIPFEEKNTAREIIKKTMIEGIVQNIEIKIRKKNHSLFLTETSATLIQDPDGAPFSFMIIMRDISQRKKM
ncbi:MAG: PAS domain S-box protein, partial [Bacteroidetes bacterium]|nr:PAS domain S-box protein [Bacteroidota bacterium]